MLKMIQGALAVALLMVATVVCVWADEAVTVESKFPRMSWGPLGRAVLADLPAGTLVTTKGLKMIDADLSAEIADAPSGIREQLKNYSFFALEQMVTRKLLGIEAAAWAQSNKVNKKPDELLGAYLDSVVSRATVTDAEVEKFRKDNEAMLREMLVSEQKTEVRKFLEQRQRDDAIERHVRSVGGRHKIELSAAWADAEYQKWITNPVEAARRSGKPSLLDFNAEWCMPCKQMAPIISGFREQYKDRLNVVLINTDKEPILAAHYGANSIPLLLLYDKDGKEVFRHNGALPKEDIQNKLNALGL